MNRAKLTIHYFFTHRSLNPSLWNTHMIDVNNFTWSNICCTPFLEQISHNYISNQRKWRALWQPYPKITQHQVRSVASHHPVDIHFPYKQNAFFTYITVYLFHKLKSKKNDKEWHIYELPFHLSSSSFPATEFAIYLCHKQYSYVFMKNFFFLMDERIQTGAWG